MFQQHRQGWNLADNAAQSHTTGGLFQNCSTTFHKGDGEGARSLSKNIKPINSNFQQSFSSSLTAETSSSSTSQGKYNQNSYLNPQSKVNHTPNYGGERYQYGNLKSTEKLSKSSFYGENERSQFSPSLNGFHYSKHKGTQSVSYQNQNSSMTMNNSSENLQNGNLSDGSILNQSSYSRNNSVQSHKVQSTNTDNPQQQASHTYQSSNHQANHLQGKLSIQTSADDNRSFNSNSFSSYSSTNFGNPYRSKHSQAASVGKSGPFSSKHQDKINIDYSAYQNSNKNYGLDLESQQIPSPFTLQARQQLKINEQEPHQEKVNFSISELNQLKQQTTSHLQVYQNNKEESPIFKNKNKNKLFSFSPQGKKSVGSSMHLQDVPLSFKESEGGRIIKSSQGSELDKIFHLSKQQAQNDQSIPNGDVNKRSVGFQQLKQSISKEEQEEDLEVIGKKEPLPNHEPTKCSFKRNGIVKAYAANTNQGLVRNYNEDRVSIILNIMKPASRANEAWPKCSFFGVYDGHGGVNCADFLRDNLHQFVIKEPTFPCNPKEALRNGFNAAEKAFMELASTQEEQIDRSGSCAIVILIVGDTCYVANVGDSRAVLSGEGGQKVFTLSRDHKPADDQEQKRIILGGGKIYQTHATQVKQSQNDSKTQSQLVVGPLRVFPGRLSVSRTFGDIEAKLEKLGGNPKVVICDPEIKSFKITEDHDFIVLASDGVYDKMTSKDVIQSVWGSTSEEIRSDSVHKQCSASVETILRDALNKKSLDNVTVVMIAFQNFKDKLFPSEKQDKSFTNQEKVFQQHEKKPKLPLEEIKNYQYQGVILPQDTPLSSTTKYNFLNSATSGIKSSTAASSVSYLGEINRFDKDSHKSSAAMTPNYRASTGESQIRKKLKENQGYGNNENQQFQMNNNNSNSNSNIYDQLNIQSHSNITTSSSVHQQLNKLKLLEQKISEASQKVNQYSVFDRKVSTNSNR